MLDFLKGCLIWFGKTLKVLLALWCIWCIFIILSLYYPNFFTSKEKMFQLVFKEVVPPGVKLLEGHGSFWMGYSITLVFTADQTTFAGLAKGRQKLGTCSETAEPSEGWPSLFSSCSSIKYVFKEYVTQSSRLTCFYKTGTESHETSELCYDESTQTAYLHARQS